ncbi:hypothetical protein [Salinilacustrithrix flava]|uniref:hypothetical protein n=1 Tax=Salinilacustrithrix flava TaxID=2957203 RepID=UPI003D7C2543
MELFSTIDSTFADLAKTVDQGTVAVAERLPAPVDALALRLGAVNAEALRQYGRVTATTVDAVYGVVNVAWTGAAQLIDASGDALEASAGTLRTTGRRAVGDARQASSTITNRARGAADQVQRNLSVVADRAGTVEDRVETETEAAADKVVKAADTGVAETGRTGANRPSGPYESWSKDELYERAQELDLDGRSTMSKDQLVKALRSA